MFEDPSCYALIAEDYNIECRWVLDRCWNKMPSEPGEFVLDAGSGTGSTTYESIRNVLRPDFKSLIGVDICPKMVDYALSHWKDDPRLHFAEMDLSTKNDPWLFFDKEIKDSGGFHKITSFFCLHWVKDRHQTLRNFHTLLRPGGHALLYFIYRSPSFPVWDELASREKWRSFFREMNHPFNVYYPMTDPVGVFKSDAEKAGFIADVELVERKDAFMSYTKNDEEVRTRLRSIDPVLRLLPEDMKDDYIEEQLEIIKSRDTRGPVGFRALLAILKKT